MKINKHVFFLSSLVNIEYVILIKTKKGFQNLTQGPSLEGLQICSLNRCQNLSNTLKNLTY